MMQTMARTLAAMMGSYLLACLVAGALDPRLDGTVWLVDLRAVPDGVRGPWLATLAATWLAMAIRLPGRATLRGGLTVALTGLAGVFALADAVRFWRLLAAGAIDTAWPWPLSLLVLAGLGLMLGGLLAPVRSARSWHRGGVALTTALATLVLFTLGQMFAFGKTDYRRPADAIVVFGARAYADGRCSDALADRVRTACELYHGGYAPRLIFSGGPGDGSIHETQAMRRLALSLGVPDQAITVDEWGLNTRATVQATARLDHGRLLAVSHFYHLPRVKLAYQRAGVEVFTVPARERRRLTKMPLLIAREFAALWYYALTC